MLLPTLMTELAFIPGMAFDPFFRGFLSVLVGVIVLIGGTYLIVATNTGPRQGMLIAMAGLFGWNFLMGIVWTIYGIGWRGQPPTWELVEINTDTVASSSDGLLFAEEEWAPDLYQVDLSSDVNEAAAIMMKIFTESELIELASQIPGPDAAELVLAQTGSEMAALADADQEGRASMMSSLSTEDVAGVLALNNDPDLAQEVAKEKSRGVDLGEWTYLTTADSERGEAQSAADTFLIERGVFEGGDYLPLQFGGFVAGGKPRLELDEEANFFSQQASRAWHFVDETVLHPVHPREIIMIQAQHIIPKPTLPGQAPPVAEIDPDAPLVSVIMERDRGGPIPAVLSGLRFTPVMFTVANLLIFLIFALLLHVRDKEQDQVLAAASA
jgi:uncharacterized membrane protein